MRRVFCPLYILVPWFFYVLILSGAFRAGDAGILGTLQMNVICLTTENKWWQYLERKSNKGSWEDVESCILDQTYMGRSSNDAMWERKEAMPSSSHCKGDTGVATDAQDGVDPSVGSRKPAVAEIPLTTWGLLWNPHFQHCLRQPHSTFSWLRLH